MIDKEIRIGTVHRMPRVLNDGIALLLVLRGSVTLEYEHTSCLLGEGGVAVINDRDFYSLKSEAPNILVWMRFSREYMTARFLQISQYRFSCIYCAQGDDETTYTSMQKYMAELAFLDLKKTAEAQLRFQSVFFQMLHLLVTEFSLPITQPLESDEDQRMKRALAYIHQNYKNRILLSDVARHVFLSPQYLSRLFKTVLHTTYLDYVGALRLSSAKYDLLHTRSTITKISMSNGFASDKAMCSAFVAQYGMTPNEYRNAHRPAEGETEEPYSASFINEKQDNALEVLAKFIDSFQRGGQLMPAATPIFDLNAIRPTELRRISVIVDIGDIHRALRSDCKNQLDLVRANLDVKYVAFSGILTAIGEAGHGGTPFWLYDVFQIVTMIRNLGMFPFVQLNLNGLHSESFERLLSVLDTLSLRYSVDELSRWYFEAVGEADDLREHFPQICAILHDRISGASVGLRLLTDSVDAVKSAEVLRALSCCTVDFLSFSSDPNVESFSAESATYAVSQRNFHQKRVEKLRALADAAGLQNIPVFMTDWNTLTGKTTVEAGEFHRTALITDTLCRLSGQVSGFSVRLSLDGQGGSGNSIITHPLSLFLYRGIRRPMFFVFRAMASLKDSVAAQGEGYLLTHDFSGNIALLLYNACYINPFLALDNLRKGSHAQVVSFRLAGLPAGRYRIKKYLMDKDNGSLYHSWVKLDLSSPLDEEDIDDYLENISNPSVMLYEEATTGELFIQQELAMNATALFVMKRYQTF